MSLTAMNRTIEIPLPEELLRRVDEKAHTSGLDRGTYIRAILSREVTGTPSISEILLPFREQVIASGVSDEELDRLFSQAREEAYRDRNPTKDR